MTETEPTEIPVEPEEKLSTAVESSDHFSPAPEPEQTEPEEADTFPREYVERLRDENAKYRQRAGRADELGKRLHVALVAATGRLADPSDLDFDEGHLDDGEALQSAIDGLLERKPHLASRRPRGDIGQGMSGTHGTVNLAGLLRANA